MSLAFTNPNNHERAVTLAYAMYGHISEAGMGGLPFADVVGALAMVGGLLLSGAYGDNEKNVEVCAFGIAQASVAQAKLLAGQPREGGGQPKC